jgi:creatinine amidohydrolase
MRALLLMTLTICTAVTVPGSGIQAQREPRGIRLSDITWQQAADALRPETVVILPLGAGSQEHGPHLKLGNDAVLADYLTRRVLEASDVVVAPSLPYHFSPAFVDYPGSASLTSQTAQAMTTEAVMSLARFGPRRFYVLNTDRSTTSVLERTARGLAAQGVLLEYTDLASRLDRASAPVRQQESGVHADEVDTSMMLYIDPASVDVRRAVRELGLSTDPLRLTPRRGAPGTFSASGVLGDPTLATQTKGRVIVESLVAAVLEDIERLRSATPQAPVSTPTAPAGVLSMPPQRRPDAGSRTCTPADERTIRSLGDAFTLHWRNADAAQLAALWSLEGDVVHPDGVTERGREVIRANRAALFIRHEYRGSRHPVTIGNIRCVAFDVAVADGKWEMGGVSDASGNALPTFEGLLTLVVKRSGEGGWLVEAYRYTQKPAAAPMPVLLKRPGFPGAR